MASCGSTENNATTLTTPPTALTITPIALTTPPTAVTPPLVPLLVRAKSAVFHAASVRRRQNRFAAGNVEKNDAGGRPKPRSAGQACRSTLLLRPRTCSHLSADRRSPSCRSAPPPPPIGAFLADGSAPQRWSGPGSSCVSSCTGSDGRCGPRRSCFNPPRHSQLTAREPLKVESLNAAGRLGKEGGGGGGGLLGKRTSPNQTVVSTSGTIRTVVVYPTCPSPPKTSTHRPPSGPKTSTHRPPSGPITSTYRPPSEPKTSTHRPPSEAITSTHRPPSGPKTTGTVSVIMPANQSSPWGGGGGGKPRLGSSSRPPDGSAAADKVPSSGQETTTGLRELRVRVTDLTKNPSSSSSLSSSSCSKQRSAASLVVIGENGHRTAAAVRCSASRRRDVAQDVGTRTLQQRWNGVLPAPQEGPLSSVEEGLEPPASWRPADARLRSSGGGASSRESQEERGSPAAPPSLPPEERSSPAAPPSLPSEERSPVARPPCRAAPFLSSSEELESHPPPPPPSPRSSGELEESPEVGTLNFTEAVQKLIKGFLLLPPHLNNGTLANGTLANGTLANGSLANGTLASGTMVNGSLANGSLASGSLASGTLASGSLANGSVANGSLANGTQASGPHSAGGSAVQPGCLPDLETKGQSAARVSRTAEPTAATVCSLPISPGGAGVPEHKTEATAAVPSFCLSLSDRQGALQHVDAGHANNHPTTSSTAYMVVGSTDDRSSQQAAAAGENSRFTTTTTNSLSDKTVTQNGQQPTTPGTDPLTAELNGRMDSARSTTSCKYPSSATAALNPRWPTDSSAMQDSQPNEPMDTDCLQASNQMSASVGSVTNQISAIHLTNRPAPSFPSNSAEERVIGGQQIVDEEDDDDDFPDELENGCSDDDGSDCSSIIDGFSAASNAVLSSMSSGTEDDREERPALVPSMFPHFPPTLYFSTAEERVALLPPDQSQMLKWKMTTVTPNVVKNTIARSHFRATKRSHDWLGCWGHHMKSPGFKPLREYQKLNHFPGSFQIGRKDRLWRNLHKMQTRFGRQEFGFFPRSFILPQDIKLLRKAWEDGGSKQKWIIKPPASARGIGIQVIHKWSQMPRKRPLLVQKYLHKPYLISGNKFDLRIYVYVTSYDPLRIYVFSDGLVRFASCKYSSSMKTLGNKFMHLTNYSVNKKNSEYESNSDDKACQGHKWALKALWKYLGDKGVNTTVIWEKIKDIIIKTIIASDPYVNSLLKMNLRSAYSCHELFGFDIMLDDNLKPWLLEVNISPSLHSNTALDVRVKGQMIRDLLNLAGFHLPLREDVTTPPSSSSSASSSTSSVYTGSRERGGRAELSTDEKVKRAFYLTQRFAEQDFLSTVLDVLTPEDVRVLAESEDELSRRGAFQRVFPSSAASSARYLRFFDVPRYLNVLLSQWETRHCGGRDKGIELLRSLCQKGVHLGTTDPLHMWSKCSYVSRFEHRPYQPYRPRSSVVVSRWSRSRRLDDDDDNDEDEEVSEREVRSLCSSMPCLSLPCSPSPSPSPSPQPTL